MSKFQANLKKQTDRAFKIVLGLTDKLVSTVFLKIGNSLAMTFPFLLMLGVALKPVLDLCILRLRLRFINQPSLIGG